MARRVKGLSPVRIMLLALNLMATYVTIFTGLGENRVIDAATGKFDLIRHRLLTGQINTDILELDMYRRDSIPTPLEMADYFFIRSPTRSVKNFGEDVSVCSRVNTNSAPVLLNMYDDFWGKGARRLQIYVYSMSTPRCDILNVKPQWHNQCITDHQENATLCYQYILDNFATLQLDESVRMLAIKDLGVSGNLFLRCFGRPLAPFEYKADRLAHQNFWNGGTYHLTLQTSDCRAVPLVRDAGTRATLYRGLDTSDRAEMLLVVPPGGWVPVLVSYLYGLVAIALIIQGIKLALFHTYTIEYLPYETRYKGKHPIVRFLMPFMDLVIATSANSRSVITFKGSLVVLSDQWMSHWLFMWLAMLDAVVNIRETYLLYQTSSALLIVRITFDGIIYQLMAITKFAWIMCLAQTVLNFVLKMGARCLRSIRVITATTREKIEWNVDSMSMFLSYRIYYLMLVLLTVVLLVARGEVSFMKRGVPFKVGAYGGPIDIADFWGSEVACDIFTLLGLLMVLSQLFGVALLRTRYKYVANNSLMRFLQKRYLIAGWDGLMAAEMLGLCPYEAGVVQDGHAFTQMSIGSLLQLLCLSGPSGFVHLGGDYIFHDNGFSQEPRRFKYSIPKAHEMGIFEGAKGSYITSQPVSSAGNMTTVRVSAASRRYSPDKPEGPPTLLPSRTRDLTDSITSRKSIFERPLRIVSDGYLGKILFVDAANSGQVVMNRETGQREYEVIDALTTMSILDIKYLMGRDKKIRVE